MDFKEYEKRAHETAICPNTLNGSCFYLSIGLAGEVGELLNKIKKIARDNMQIDKEDAKHELGDILWYLSELANSLGISMDEVAYANIEKLAKRKNEGKIHGSGDNT